MVVIDVNRCVRDKQSDYSSTISINQHIVLLSYPALCFLSSFGFHSSFGRGDISIPLKITAIFSWA